MLGGVKIYYLIIYNNAVVLEVERLDKDNKKYTEVLEAHKIKRIKKEPASHYRESRLSVFFIRPARRLSYIQISLHLLLFPYRIWDNKAGTEALPYLYTPWSASFYHRLGIGSILISVVDFQNSMLSSHQIIHHDFLVIHSH